MFDRRLLLKKKWYRISVDISLRGGISSWSWGKDVFTNVRKELKKLVTKKDVEKALRIVNKMDINDQREYLGIRKKMSREKAIP